MKALDKAHFDKFRKKVLPAFVDAAERAASGEANPWPASMRVKKVVAAQGIWEMTWSKSNPDGRATWEWVVIDGEPAIMWRRVGTHDVFDRP